MPPFPHIVIRASAGTGKTFQLSNRFIGLVCAGGPADHILAATFARKAAGEILERVLIRLAGAAGDPTRLAELGRHVGDETLDRSRCLQLLQVLLRNLHRLRIGTLDSFFVQMAGSFSLDLGLPPGWRIVDELDDQRLRAEAIQAVLEAESTADLLTLLHLLTKGEATRSVTNQLSEIVNDLYEIFRDTTREAWHALPRLTPLRDEELADALGRLVALRDLPNKFYSNARDSDLERATRLDWQDFIGKGLAVAVIDGKDSFQRKPIPAEVFDAYRPLIDHARAVLIGHVANQTEATYRVLEKFDGAYQRLKIAQRALRFEDVTRTLAAGLAGGRMDEIAYRLDAHCAHLLLDEFQDTSLAQWAVVRPFAERVVRSPAFRRDSPPEGGTTNGGDARSFFCVGDVKQAIYRWRGGVSEIFDAVGEQLPGLVTQSLLESHRSSQVVIDTVNAVFGNPARNGALADQPEVAGLWSKRFEPHTTAKAGLPGYCRLVAAPRAGENEKQGDATLVFAAKEIARLSRECPGKSIGVLVRKNKAVARLIYELRTNQQIPASEEGGNPLTDSAAVQLILSLLKLADHPGDTVARFHVATSPLGRIVGLEKHDDAAAAIRLACDVRDRLVTAGYGRTIYGWVQELAASCNGRELNRLLQLVELAYGYEANATLRADDFVRYVTATRVEAPATADVRVMTVHQAKGLQFDMVVLPELDGHLKGQTPRLVTGRDKPTDPIQRVCRYANDKIQALLPAEFQQLFANWWQQVVSESLCLLYVALTRPVHALHMIVAPSGEREKALPKSFAGVLRSALTPGDKAEPQTILYEHGDPNWFAKEFVRSPAFRRRPPPKGGTTNGVIAESPSETITIHLREQTTPPRRGLDRQSPSTLAGGSKVNLAQRLQVETSLAASRGTLVHAWLEQIAWIEDGIPDDTLLRSIARPLLTPDLDLAAEIARFHQMLARPAIRHALSRRAGFQPASDPVELEVWRERDFAFRDGDVLLCGTFDRVVVISRDGRPLAAAIIDFKTNQLADAAAIDAAVEHYRPQLSAYRRAAAHLTRLDPMHITAHLAFVEPGVVRTIAHLAE